MRMLTPIVCMWIFAYAAIKVARIFSGNWDHPLIIRWPSAAPPPAPPPPMQDETSPPR